MSPLLGIVIMEKAEVAAEFHPGHSNLGKFLGKLWLPAAAEKAVEMEIEMEMNGKTLQKNI